ncbi:MAG: peptide chain release factor N(5)-glutamine methyltransferase [Clostridia bacterium]|nr:peptide chain release factor N(5)-glutamine methyltransferase [Clostridia bacterium]
MTIREIINEYKDKFENVQDIYSIIKYVTEMDNIQISLYKDLLLPEDFKTKIIYYLDKIINENYPVQYITNSQAFFNEVYYVDEHVLIPRQDTEILVEKAIDYIRNEGIKDAIDLCTGSGAIGISVARNSDIEKVTLIDISEDALDVAYRNIEDNSMEDKVTVLQSNLLEEVIKNQIKTDMILSNPPYIKSEDMASLDANVKYEPALALDGGATGMNFYEKIIEQAKYVLNNNGLLIFEIGYDELEQMKELIAKNKEYTMLESVKDYGGNDRVVVCRFQQM